MHPLEFVDVVIVVVVVIVIVVVVVVVVVVIINVIPAAYERPQLFLNVKIAGFLEEEVAIESAEDRKSIGKAVGVDRE